MKEVSLMEWHVGQQQVKDAAQARNRRIEIRRAKVSTVAAFIMSKMPHLRIKFEVAFCCALFLSFLASSLFFYYFR